MKRPSHTPSRLPGMNAPEKVAPSGLLVSAKWNALIHSASHSRLDVFGARQGGVADGGFM